MWAREHHVLLLVSYEIDSFIFDHELNLGATCESTIAVLNNENYIDIH